MDWNSPKLHAGFFFGIGFLLLAVVLYDLIGKREFNASAVFLCLVMLLFAFRANKNKQNK